MLAAHDKGAYGYRQIAQHFGIHFTTVERIVRAGRRTHTAVHIHGSGSHPFELTLSGGVTGRFDVESGVMAVSGISWSGVLWRIAFAIALVGATYNPSGHSFYHWLLEPPAGLTAVKALLGVLLLIGWVICLRTAFVALGRLGVILGAALFAALVWVLVELKFVDISSPSALTWVALIILGAILGLGLSWSLIRARATGQIEVQ